MTLKISMKKKIAKTIVSALGNVLIFGAKKAGICVKIHFPLSTTREEQKTDVLSAVQKIQQSENKFTDLF